MRQGRDALVATGSLVRPRWLAFLAEAIAKSDSAREGLKLLAHAMALLDSTEERMYEAELHRLKGEALLMENAANATDAERCFRVTIEISRSQSAKSLELRATMSLARLLAMQADAMKRAPYSPKSTIGSPKASTTPT
jgi:predicted ATPase